MLKDYSSVKIILTKKPYRINRSKRRLFYLSLFLVLGLIWLNNYLSYYNENQVTLAIPTPTSLPPLKALDTLSWHPIDIKDGSSIAKSLQLAGVDAASIALMMQQPLARHYFSSVQPHQGLSIALDQQHQLQILKLTQGLTSTLIVHRASDGKFLAKLKQNIPATHISVQQGTVHHSYYTSAQQAGLNSGRIIELAHLFEWNIDFNHSIQNGDQFKIISQTYTDQKQQQVLGPILAAEFTNHNHHYRVLRFTDHLGKTGYYSFDGQGITPAFLRAPLHYTRISDKFSNGRYHPILHYVRRHTGVDFAAPRGTPVKAAGKGFIRFIGQQRGYGNVLIINHGHGFETLYAHLDHFATQLKLNSTIEQGQIIGFVGKTGLATGPHLHYEFHIHHTAYDPLTVKLPQSDAVAAVDMQRFQQTRQQWFSALSHQI